MEPQGAVVIGGYVNGLGVARALAELGVRVAVIRTQPFDIAHTSRCVDSSAKADDLADKPERLLEVLDRHRPNWRGRLLVPTTDEALSALARHHEALSVEYRVAAPRWDVTRQFLDKNLMLAAARAVGLDVPRSYGPAANLNASAPEILFPVVVKPISSHEFQRRFGSKLFVARDGETLQRAARLLAAENIDAEVFDLVPGDDSEIYAYCTYVDVRGEPSRGLTIRKLRQSPPGFGVARVAELVDDVPAVRDSSLALLEHLGFRGIAAIEFKRDPRDGRFRFLEVNGRAVVYNNLLRRGGLDLAALAWSDYALGSRVAACPNGWRGVWIHLHADVLYSALYRRGENLSWTAFSAPYRREKVFAVWSAADPRPFVTQWGRTAGELLAGLKRRQYRSRLEDRTLPPA